jgi:hypothetical protein
MKPASLFIQRYALALLVLLLAGCDKDVSPLTKSYTLASQVSLTSRYASAPVLPVFRNVFNGNDGNSMLVLTLGAQHIVVLIDEAGNFIKEVRLPGLQQYIASVKQEADGSLIIAVGDSQTGYGYNDFHRVDPDLNLTSEFDVQTLNDLTSFALRFFNGRTYYHWNSSMKEDESFTGLLSKYTVESGLQWSTDVTAISNRNPILLFNSSGETLVIRSESEDFSWGKVDRDGKILWTRVTKWADVFPEGYRWGKFYWKINGELLISSLDTEGAPESIFMATFSNQGNLEKVTEVPLDGYKDFANQTLLGASKIIQTNDNGYMVITATLSGPPPFATLVKLDRKFNTGWIGKVNLLGDVVADAAQRQDGSIVLVTAQGLVLVFNPEF